MNTHQSTHHSPLRFEHSSTAVWALFCRCAFATLSRSFSASYRAHSLAKLSQPLSMMRVGGFPPAFCFTLAFTCARPELAV